MSRQCQESASELPNYGMTAAETAGTRRCLELALRPHPSLQLLVIAFDAIVEILRGPMLHGRQQGAQGLGVTFRFVSCDLGWRNVTCGDSPLKECLDYAITPPLTQVDIDNLTLLADGSI